MDEYFIKFKNTEKEIKENEYIQFIEMINSTEDKLEQSIVFIDELHNENKGIRLFCIRNLHITSEVIGQKRTDEELLPMLIDMIINKEDDEEVLIEISNKIFDISKSVTVLKALEILSGSDDDIVREHATKKLCEFIELYNEEDINNEVFPLMKRLIDNDVKSKVSCCCIFPIVLSKLSNESTKSQLIQAYFEVSKEEAPSVRKSAAYNIRKFYDIFGKDKKKNAVLKELLALLLKLMKDQVDIVKSVSIETAGEVLLYLDKEDTFKVMNSILALICPEETWRVRHAACNAFGYLIRNQYILKDENSKDMIKRYIVMLMKDTEPEVKVCILKIINDVVEIIGIECFDNEIFNDMIGLIDDSNYHVRTVLFDVLFILLKSSKNIDRLLSILYKVLKEDIYEVKVNSLSHIGNIVYVINNKDFIFRQDYADKVISIIDIISKDCKWRIRNGLACKLVFFMKHIQKDFFKRLFKDVIINFYSDMADVIRKESVNVMVEIMKNDLFEDEKFVLTLIKSHLLSKNYILRITGIYTIEKIYENICVSQLTHIGKGLNDMLLSMSNDKIPNVKFNFCKAVKVLKKNKKNVFDFESLIRNANEKLEFLIKDDDEDVRFYANEALISE